MEKLKEYLKLALERLKSTTPKYFKKIINFGLGLGALGIAFFAASSMIPPILASASTYMIAVGITCAVVAKQTTVDPELTKKSDDLLGKTKLEPKETN